MLKICLDFWKSEPHYAYRRYAYKKTCKKLRGMMLNSHSDHNFPNNRFM